MKGRPFLRVKSPEPREWHNLASWREEHNWDQHGTMADITATRDPDKPEFHERKGDVKSLAGYKDTDSDLYGHPIAGHRLAGPFADLTTGPESRKVDPRQ